MIHSNKEERKNRVDGTANHVLRGTIGAKRAVSVRQGVQTDKVLCRGRLPPINAELPKKLMHKGEFSKRCVKRGKFFSVFRVKVDGWVELESSTFQEFINLTMLVFIVDVSLRITVNF